MKLLNIALFTLLSTFTFQSANAQRVFEPGSHIYKNAAGDRFEITIDQTAFTFKDLQLGDVYHTEAGHMVLQRQPTPTERIMGTLGRFAPISLGINHNNNSELILVMRAQLPIKQDGSALALTSPLIEMKLYIAPSYNSPGSLDVALDGIKAVYDVNDSVVQRAFLRGINLILDLVYRNSHSATYEQLTRIN